MSSNNCNVSCECSLAYHPDIHILTYHNQLKMSNTVHRCLFNPAAHFESLWLQCQGIHDMSAVYATLFCVAMEARQNVSCVKSASPVVPLALDRVAALGPELS